MKQDSCQGLIFQQILVQNFIFQSLEYLKHGLPTICLLKSWTSHSPFIERYIALPIAPFLGAVIVLVNYSVK